MGVIVTKWNKRQVGQGGGGQTESVPCGEKKKVKRVHTRGVCGIRKVSLFY